MVEATIFISLLITAVVQIIKMFVPQIHGAVTIIVALFVGVLVAIIGGRIGVTEVSIAEGIVAAFGAIGLSTLASKAGGGAKGDEYAA